MPPSPPRKSGNYDHPKSSRDDVSKKVLTMALFAQIGKGNPSLKAWALISSHQLLVGTHAQVKRSEDASQK